MLEAFQAALALEKFNNQSLLELHSLAAQNNDAQVCCVPVCYLLYCVDIDVRFP
jgi:hypothetical protein